MCIKGIVRTVPFATSVLDGFHVCIFFAFGQTSTGKTFTMEEIEGAQGVNYRNLEELFRIIKEREDPLNIRLLSVSWRCTMSRFMIFF